MRRLILGWLVLTACTASARAAETPLNVLFVGNSYTQGYMPVAGGKATFAAVPDAVARLAVADGHPKPRVVQVAVGGKSLAFHLAQATTRPSLSVDNNAGRPWTHVVLQDLSTRPAAKASGEKAVGEFVSDVKQWASMIRRNSPAARAVLFETWPRRGDAWLYPKTYADPRAMQADLTRSYASAAAELNAADRGVAARVAPVGTAFGLMDYDRALYNPDGSHSTVLGYRLSAMVLYRTIYDERVGDIPYAAVASWIGLSREQYEQARAVADRVELSHSAGVDKARAP